MKYLITIPRTLLAVIPVVAMTFAQVQAHDESGSGYATNDDANAAAAAEHARRDRQHADGASARANATGDPEDIGHAIGDDHHAQKAERSAADAAGYAEGHDQARHRRHHHHN